MFALNKLRERKLSCGFFLHLQRDFSLAKASIKSCLFLQQLIVTSRFAKWIRHNQNHVICCYTVLLIICHVSTTTIKSKFNFHIDKIRIRVISKIKTVVILPALHSG